MQIRMQSDDLEYNMSGTAAQFARVSNADIHVRVGSATQESRVAAPRGVLASATAPKGADDVRFTEDHSNQ